MNTERREGGRLLAQVNQRLWKIPGQRTKRKAWGFTAQINGNSFRSAWEAALAAAGIESSGSMICVTRSRPGSCSAAGR